MNYLYMTYLILLSTVLPIYMKSGYAGLGEAKAYCYIVISAPFAVFFLINGIIRLIKKEEKRLGRLKFFLYATLLSCIISLVFSVDKKMAFWGYEGWRTGFAATFLAIIFSFAYQNKVELKRYFVALLMVVPFAEFVLSILNRFRIYPIAIEGQNNSFLATLGNIGWFSGYLSIWVPLGIAMLHVQRKFTKEFFLLSLYTITGLVSLMLQGSDGAALIIFSSYGLLLWCSLSDRDSFKKYLFSLLILGISMTIADIMLSIFKNSYNYESNLLANLCKNHVGLIIMAATFFLYRLIRLFEEIKVEFREKILKRIYMVVLSLCLIGVIVFLAIKFDDSFGNGRGIIIKMCASIFMGLSSWQKLVGIGQDCLYSYAMNDPVWSSEFYNTFGNSALTNAHCELLTILIERGIVGAFFYIGLFTSVLISLIRVKEKEHVALIYALPIISYFMYNQVSFAQLTSMPYVYILIGMAINLTKVRNGN